jgi:hypothetical protein
MAKEETRLSREEIDALADDIALTAAHLDARTHRLLDGIRRFDAAGGWAWQGARSCAHWLSWRIGVGLGAAREQVRVARALGGLPLIDEALAHGALSFAKVRAMTRVATPESEALLLQYATSSTGAQLERICRSFRKVVRVGVVGADQDERFVRRRHLDSGMVRIEAQLHPDEAELVMKAISEARRAFAHQADVSAETSPSQPTLADGLVLAAESFVAQGPASRKGAERTQLFVHLTEDRLAREGALRAVLSDGTVLSGPTLQRLACDAGLVVAKVDDAGRPLDVGRKRRTVSPALERALWMRDGGCRFPGCCARAYCEAHHIEHWSEGGVTSLANTCLLCHFHHTALHEGGFRMDRDGAGALRFFDPDGNLIAAVPASGALGTPSFEGPSDPRINLARSDGSNADYGACVAGLLAQSGSRALGDELRARRLG